MIRGWVCQTLSLLFLFGFALLATPCSAQDPSSAKPAANPANASRPGGMGFPGGFSGPPGSQSPSTPGANTNSPMPPMDSKDDSEPNGDAQTTSRPNMPPQPPDPSELAVEPDEEGLVQFSFQGQPWPDVLEWLARNSGRTLDWQELPADYLNLTVRRKYTLDEARDLINRHLLARGFTLLEHGEGFSVVKTDKLNPALVQRVAPEQLEEHFPHEFAKTSFDLDWLIAEDLVKEFEALKSPNGKLIALATTNRLEAMDAVANLRDMYRVLQEEQSGKARHRLVREFTLEHVKAEVVQQQLETFLGLESSRPAPAAPMNAQQMQMLQQQMQMQAQMQAQQAQAGQAAAQARPKGEIRLVADVRRNTLIAHSPPDRMAIIESFIELVDVPTGAAESLDAYMNRMRVYRLASLDAEQFVKSLIDMNVLAPSTKLQPDTSNNAIIVDAGLADHFTIKSIIDRLDGSGRRFEVIPLRRHAADEVAGSIEFLMGANVEEKEPRRNRYDYGYYSFSFAMPQQEAPKSRDKFRVGANLEFNQLLLWANDIELKEVEALLIKLGEIVPRDGGSQIRTLEIPFGIETEEFLRRLQREWPSIAPNPLVVPDASGSRASPPGNSPETPADPLDTEPKRSIAPGLQDTRVPRPRHPFHTAAGQESNVELAVDRSAGGIRKNKETLTAASGAPNETVQASSPPNDGAGTPEPAENPTNPLPFSGPAFENTRPAGHAPTAAPPVSIRVDPDGHLIIASEDLRALGLLEQWLAEAMPKPRRFEVFKLKYAPAYWVALNLEDFFEEEEKDDRQRRDMASWWWGGGPPPSNDPAPRQLGKRRPIRFIADDDTNTIVVQGADQEQLRIIAELVELYDIPEPMNAQTARVTKLFHVKYSKAVVIAETIKDAYRDLLSSNDKALQGAQQQQQNNRPEATIIRNYGPQIGGDADNSNQEKRTQITFKGKLSIGIDEITNTLLVSAEGESLLNIIGEMIEQLDTAAKPQERVQVLRLNSNINPEQISTTLRRILQDGKPTTSSAPAAPAPQAPATPQQQTPTVVIEG